MFHRTNLTLSARTLSNRLDLGTRSLALNAGVNHGGQFARIRTADHGVMREGMVWYDVLPTIQPEHGGLAIPGSFFPRRQSLSSCPTRQPGPPAEDVRVEPESRPANLVDRPERCARAGGPRFPSAALTAVERRSANRMSGSAARSGWKSSGGAGLKRSAPRVAEALAATAIADAAIGK
jgi:hypothetical protein